MAKLAQFRKAWRDGLAQFIPCYSENITLTVDDIYQQQILSDLTVIFTEIQLLVPGDIIFVKKVSDNVYVTSKSNEVYIKGSNKEVFILEPDSIVFKR